MRVLHVIASVADIRGGPSRAILDMVNALNYAGVDAEIATTNDAGSSLLDVPLYERVQYQGVPVYFFPRFSPPVHAIREFAFSWPLAQWLWNHLDDYDLVHVHALFSMPCTLTMVLARLKNIPYILAPHGLLCRWSLQQSAQRKATYLRLIEHANLNHSAGLHLNSQLEQRELEAVQLTAPSFVLSHGLHPAELIPDARQKLRTMLKLAPDEPIILFLSRLHPKKGLDLLIAALSQLRHRRFTFVIAGSGDSDYEVEIDQLLQDHRLSDRTCRVGFVEGEKKNICLQGADLFVLTSHSENFGVVVLEALASRLPVVLTPGVALSDLINTHQLGAVAELNEGAIAKSIEHLLNNPDLRTSIGDRARPLVLERYTWNAIGTQLGDRYKTALAQEVS
ncbi:MAG: glycosyltransferase [Cyanobacteria bacterium J06638_22]